VVGVLLLQWGVMFVLACQDPSHACLLKLLHMDMLATCVTLPTEQKWVWDMLAIVRTVGEDMPQAVLQTIYLVKVKKNFFMLLSVMMAVSASLKALYDARARALAAAGAGEEYDNRERDYIIYSCSQDGTIKSWNIKEGCCVKTIVADSPANTVAATRGMLYSSHDVGEMLEWSLETGDRSRTFQHTGANGELVATVDFLFTWAVEDDTLEMDETAKTTYKMWSLDSGDCIREFMGPRTDEVRLFVKGDNFFATAPEDDSAVAHWNIHSGERLGTFVGHGARINAIFATHKRLVTGARDGHAKEWALSSQRETRAFPDHGRKHVAALAVVGERMYNSARAEPVINEWNLLTGQLLRRFAGHTRPVSSAVVLQQKLYSASEDGTVKEWSLDSGECDQTFKGHEDSVWQVMLMCRN